jgi:hypothetical protein
MNAAGRKRRLSTWIGSAIGNFPVDENYLPYTKEIDAANRKTFS